MIMDNEQPRQELVKCVVVGDTAVGKTRLICARACNSRMDLSQLMTTHIPTVWAIDQYRIHKEVLERSWEVIDGVNVSLRLWDTFGDHDKDRHFAYGRSDVVLLCFSVANPISLRNCKVVWYPEIRRFCPNTPIVLVGCKNDLRYMFRDEKFLSLCRERSPFFRANHLCSRFPELGRPLKETDILTPEQGRMIAKDIEAPYYETSVFTHYGVNEVFENVIRVALIARRQQRFWMTNLKHVRHSLIQKPFCPPKPSQIHLTTPESQFEKQIIHLLQNQSYTDVILSIGKSGICAHKVILAAASTEFYKLFTMDLTSENDNLSNGICRSVSDSSIGSSSDNTVGNFNTDTEQLISISSGSSDEKPPLNKFNLLGASFHLTRNLLPSNIDCSNGNFFKRRLSFHLESTSNCFKSNVHKNISHPLFQSISIEYGDNIMDFDGRFVPPIQVVVSLSNITLETFQHVVKFAYSGRLNEQDINSFTELTEIAEVLNLRELLFLTKNLSNNKGSDDYINQKHSNDYLTKFKLGLRRIWMEGLFSDVIFQVDDGTCSAHKAVLMARCDMMDAMFRGDFLESSAKIIQFPEVNKETFCHLLTYLYTDCIDSSINHSNCLQILEFANRLCLPRLVALIECQVVDELNKFNENGVDITEIALKLLEPCQLHNANQLADWCLYQISIHYNDICHKNTKLLRSLHPENQAYLNRNRWPPVWYLKEYDYYERCVREREWQENPPKGKKRHRLNSGCLCFSGKSRKNEAKMDN